MLKKILGGTLGNIYNTFYLFFSLILGSSFLLSSFKIISNRGFSEEPIGLIIGIGIGILFLSHAFSILKLKLK